MFLVAAQAGESRAQIYMEARLFTVEILLLVILLPIIPAFLLFKALPAWAELEGPFQGLQLKLGGAFAGYFAIFILVLADHSWLLPPPPPIVPYQVWEVSGRIIDENGQPVQPIDSADLQLNPRMIDTDEAGVFKLHFYSWPNTDGSQSFPRLSISHKNYQAVPVQLDPKLAPKNKGLTVTVDGHNIDLHDISLRQLSTAYPNNLTPLNAGAANVSH